MALREVASQDRTIVGRPHQLQRIVVQDGRFVAEWTVTLATGRRATRVVPVSDAANAILTGAASYAAMLDRIQSDTFPRTGAGG